MTLVPWDEFDNPVTDPFFAGLDQVREAYCELGDRVPVFRDLPLNRFIRSRACGESIEPSFEGPRLGQCENVEYGLLVGMIGTLENGTTFAGERDFQGVQRVYGPIGDFRAVQTSGGWGVEVFARVNATSPPSWITLGRVLFRVQDDIDFTVPAEIINVQITSTDPSDADLESCFIPSPIPDPIDVGQPIVEIDFNPTLDITLPDVIVPVLVAPVVVAPSFELDFGDDNRVTVDFTLEGIEINDNNTTINNNISNQIDNSTQQIINNTNNQTTNLGDQITNLGDQVSLDITNEGDRIISEISTDVGGQIELAVTTAITNYFNANPVDVDLTPILNRIDALDDKLTLRFDSVDLQLTGILDALLQGFEDVQTAIQVLTDLLLQRFDDVDEALRCLDLYLKQNTCGNIVKDEGATTLSSGVAPPEGLVIFVTPARANSALVLCEILDPIPPTIRVFKLTQNASDLEGAFGSFNLAASIPEGGYALARETAMMGRFNAALLPCESGNLNAVRISLKGGVSFLVSDPGYVYKPIDPCEAEENV